VKLTLWSCAKYRRTLIGTVCSNRYFPQLVSSGSNEAHTETFFVSTEPHPKYHRHSHSEFSSSTSSTWRNCFVFGASWINFLHVLCDRFSLNMSLEGNRFLFLRRNLPNISSVVLWCELKARRSCNLPFFLLTVPVGYWMMQCMALTFESRGYCSVNPIQLNHDGFGKTARGYRGGGRDKYTQSVGRHRTNSTPNVS
jgi:hypothetical protein